MNTITDPFAAVASSVVEATTTALTAAVGTGVAATDTTVGAAFDPTGFATAVRTSFAGVTGGIVSAFASTGEPAIDTAISEALVTAAGGVLGDALGAKGAPTTAPLAIAEAASDGATVIRCKLEIGDASPVDVAWIVEAGLGSALSGGAPVAPPAAAPSPVATALPELGSGAARGATGAQPIDVLADVPMNVTVELGRTVMHVRDLLALRRGSVIELDRIAGTPVDVLVNGTPVATGDVVVVDNELGVRITEILER